MVFCFLLFLLLPPYLSSSNFIYDDDFNLILLVGLLGIFVACKIIPYNTAVDNLNARFRVDKKWTKIGFLVFLCYLLFDISIRIIQVGSIIGVFTANRLEFDKIASTGSFVYSIMLFFRILYYIRIYTYFKQKKHFKFLFFYFIPIIHHQITAITRFDFLVMVLVLVFLFIEPKLLERKKNRKQRKISKVKILAIILPLTLFSLFYMFVSNLVRHGLLLERSNQVNVGALLSESDLLNDLPYYSILNNLYESKSLGKAELEYGVSWVYYPMLTYVPRSIWKEKPPTAFSTRYTEKLYWKLGEGPVVTFTIFGEGYIQFGLLGVFIAPILFGFSRHLSFKMLKKIENTKLIVILIMFSMITYFRAEQPIVYVFLDIMYASIIINFMSKRIV